MFRLEEVPRFSLGLILFMGVIHVFQWRGSIDTDGLAFTLGQANASQFVFHPFLHGNPMHLAVVSIFMFAFGWLLERRVGILFALAIFFLGAYIGAWTWAFRTPLGDDPLIGAAGAVSAFALCTLFVVRNREVVYLLIVLWGISLVIFAPVMGFTTTPPILHFGGAAVGILGGLIARAFNLIRKDELELSMELTKVRGRPPIPGGKRPTNSVELATGSGPSTVVKSPLASETLKVELTPPREKKDLDIIGRDEAELKKIIENDPENVEVHCQLTETYLAKNKLGEAAYQGRRAIKLLVDREETGRAYDYYRRIAEKVGTFELNARFLAELIRDRLAGGEWSAAVSMIKELRRIEPTHRLLPEFIGQLIRLLILNRGPDADITRQWIADIENHYPAHPAAAKLREELEGDRALPHRFDEADAHQVLTLVEQDSVEEAADILINREDLVQQIYPLILSKMAERLLNAKQASKAAMILELTARAHLDHQKAPELIAELIGLYLTRLDRPDQAYEWFAFMQERWPMQPATARARKSVNEYRERMS